ncbi:hypothetical protein F5884DRAFT_314233 [Xylogone sp. PMI_703]|nr:hypothetical protein F5884DRAFT_314233 [Xylogone sp. PMI_703]
MASNNSGFGPPARPRDASHARRLGTSTQPGVSRPERREADIAHISGQMENRRAAIPVPHARPTGLPRPSQRAPSPSTVPRSMPESQPVVVPPSRFGFGRPARKNTSEGERAAPAAAPELKPKSSRNVLRRKPSSISVYSGSVRPAVSASTPSLPTTSNQPQRPSEHPSTEASLKSREAFNEVFGARLNPASAVPSPRIYPELDRYGTRPEVSANSDTRFVPELPHKLSTQDLPPPTPLFSGGPSTSSMSGGGHNRYSSGYSASGYSASPSTRFSESPGPGGMYSRDTTPTSISSQSPGLIAFAKPTTPRLRQGSPAQTRPPVTRRRTGSISNEAEITGPLIDPQGLPSLRESLNSSSSNSTVKGGNGAGAAGGDKGDKDAKAQKKKKRLSPLPPSPPPRKSSQKYAESPESKKSPPKSSQNSTRPTMVSPRDESPTRQRPVIPQPQAKGTPPLRPSREGAPDLLGQFAEPAAVIQSNLTGINVPQEKRRSLLPKGSVSSPPPQPTTTSRPQQPSRVPLRAASPLPLQQQKESSQPLTGLGIVPDLRPVQVPPTSSRSPALRTPSPSIANTRPRFGLFRRAKTTPEVPQVENKERPVRKGPAAGTGHEGYGKYAMRGRSNSAGSAGWTRDRSLSGASSSNEPPSHDPFFLQRMSPVIIAGGGEIVENRNTSTELPRTESNQSISQLGRPSIDSKTSSKSNFGYEAGPRTTLWPSAMPKDGEASKRTSGLAPARYRRPSDSSDDGFTQNPSRMFRRSIQRLNASATALNLPKSGISGAPSSSVSSFDGSVFSNESKTDVVRGRTAVAGPKKLSKRPKSPRKWNFFSRSQTAQKPHAEPASMSVVVEKPAVKTIPHYAMLDSSDEQQDLDAVDLEDILRDADVISLSNEELDMLQFGYIRKSTEQEPSIDVVSSPQEQLTLPEPVMFTSPEPITPEIPQLELHAAQEPTPPPRPSRLPQVGRIPKVVSARPPATSPKSFSRPFARLSVVQPLLEPIKIDEQSIALGPSPPKPSTPEPGTVVDDAHVGTNAVQRHSRHVSGDSKAESTTGSRHEFMAFSPRKNSEATTSSSGNMSFVGTTAVIPEKDAALGEDEVWDEYDDLIENDNGEDSTMKVPPSATSSHGQPFQFENYESRAVKQSQRLPKESPTIAQMPAPLELRTPLKAGPSTTSLRGSNFGRKIREALATTPTTPMSFTDFFSGYGDRGNSVSSEAQLQQRRLSRRSSRGSVSSNHSLDPNVERDGSLHLEQESDSPISQVNLRVGSMTVSKWLTFGHVLFSPAREQLMQLEESTKTHSILVIDGLGNDDWSFYAAETYPTATFYNLSPTRPIPANQSSSSFPLTPPNHRQVQYISQLDKFPFPSAYFDVVVIRFPVAMSEATYRNLISEAKRVLKSGGYLEMAILDLDLMNMGNRARRAIRGLKVRIQNANPSISLGSASDTMMRIVGKKGFLDVKTCKVGVPVASIVSRASSAQDPESTSQSEDKGKQKEELSLADMMKDESSAGDEGIMKMVSKVGRWWYTKCYEMAAMDPSGAAAVDLGGNVGSGSGSIFNDPALLAECEKWNSSFKLVVAHAQKPVTSRRRTLSV